MVLQKVHFLILCVVFMFLSSCSGNPHTTLPPNDEGLSSSDQAGVAQNQRSIIAVYDAVVDPAKGTFELIPSDRVGMYHTPLSSIYADVLKIVNIDINPSRTPNLLVDIQLKHPFPGSGITGFDPRVIALLPARPNVSFYYPTENINGNNKVILYPDGYTKLFDYKDPGIEGKVNPFVAYFKSEPYRRWSGTGKTEETLKWAMDVNGFNGSIKFKLVVDVSTNYPAAPIPITDNAKEPVALNFECTSYFMEDSDSAEFTVTALSWAGNTPISTRVSVEAPDIFSGSVNIPYSAVSIRDYEYIYKGMITNEKHPPKGYYNLLITAKCNYNDPDPHSISMYKEFPVYIASADYTPPEWQNRDGIISLTPYESSVLISYGYARDDLTPPVHYTVYFKKDDPNVWDSPIIESDLPNNEFVWSGGDGNDLTHGVYYAGVRCSDDVDPPNDDVNNIVLSCSLPTQCPPDNNDVWQNATVLTVNETVSGVCMSSPGNFDQDWYKMPWNSYGTQNKLYMRTNGPMHVYIWDGPPADTNFHDWSVETTGEHEFIIPTFHAPETWLCLEPRNTTGAFAYDIEFGTQTDPMYPASYPWQLILRNLCVNKMTGDEGWNPIGPPVQDEPYMFMTVTDGSGNILSKTDPPLGQGSDGNDLWGTAEGGSIPIEMNKVLYSGELYRTGEPIIVTMVFMEHDVNWGELAQTWSNIVIKAMEVACIGACIASGTGVPCILGCQAAAEKNESIRDFILDNLKDDDGNPDDYLGTIVLKAWYQAGKGYDYAWEWDGAHPNGYTYFDQDTDKSYEWHLDGDPGSPEHYTLVLKTNLNPE